MTSGRLSVGVVGAGPVGAVLGQALAAAGHQIVGIATTDAANIERAEALLPQVAVIPVPQIIQQSDLVLLAIPAEEIEKTVAGIAEAGLFRAGQLLAHTAGEFGFGILEPAVSKGVIPLAIHPAMTFTGTSVDLSRIRESFFAVAAPNVALPIAQALVIEMGAEPIVISEQDRKTYFEAISVANNFSKLIVNQSIGLLESVGVENARSVLAPVIRSAVEEALAEGHVPIDPEELLN
ncbi:Rossmann-like and DUF2520 domain-containing protein [Rhodoluna lacicola]|uniref:DUF2520 domain-containing protein n=1 Tax=Rhodoluna lacicola TaxID=529884 RepID=A0A060JL38_9MICO|nr:Rossmann-like and DUF2520 domain-containing protein [Rhodoluna lacicola]AIC46994.1 hypothetical protein Rhola_00001670 [Rhodoluna lacicola]